MEKSTENIQATNDNMLLLKDNLYVVLYTFNYESCEDEPYQALDVVAARTEDEAISLLNKLLDLTGKDQVLKQYITIDLIKEIKSENILTRNVIQQLEDDLYKDYGISSDNKNQNNIILFKLPKKKD